MSKLLIITQVYENYAWNEDGSLGVGDDARWKPKGGNEYFVRNIDVNRAAEIATCAAGEIECDNEAYREYVIGWEVVTDDYMTSFERDQLEFEGKIVYPTKEIAVV